MADLPARLKSFFAAPQTRTIASLTPLYLVAGASGLIIGAALATPAFAAVGLGMVLTSVAANITSSLVYDIVKPDLDAEERERAIAKGLKDRDPGVVRLVAEALAGGGPEIARALPEPLRAELIGTLRQGMQESGGALAAIAAPYTRGLANPQADWSALQTELRETIRKVSQTIEATQGGVVTGGRQEAPHTGGNVEQVMRATGPGSRVENSSQIVTGGRGTTPGAAPATTTAAPLPSEPERLQELLVRHTKRLHELEKHAASAGLETPAHVSVEISDIRAQIAQIEQRLSQ